MKHNPRLNQLLIIISFAVFTIGCALDEPSPIESATKKNIADETVFTSQARLGPLEKITFRTDDYTTRVDNVLLGRPVRTISAVFSLGNAMQSGANSTTTELVSLNKFKFNADEQKESRRPQGTAKFGNYIINSWYFTDASTWKGNCKLTVSSPGLGKYFNLVPVRFDNTVPTDFRHIKSHAGGTTVVDHFLYIANGNSILVFDLNRIYQINKPIDFDISTLENFVYEYTYMTPMVGEIIFTTESGANASYVSLAEVNARAHFVVGNFFSTAEEEWKQGGRSMIWLLPVLDSASSFPTIEKSATDTYDQIEPLFPSGDEKNKTVTRIQGVVIKDNVLILNRSYRAETYQLIVMQYQNIFNDPLVLTSFFSGTPSSKHSYDKTNWLYGCEDMEYHDNRIWTVTEFPSTDFPILGNKALYSAAYSDIYNLMKPIP